jgi:hypothetical protein
LVEAVQPLLDIILDLGLKALPYVVTGVKTFYASLAALFTLVNLILVLQFIPFGEVLYADRYTHRWLLHQLSSSR